MTIDSETSQCVNTLDLQDAEELLKETGQVVLCGPPGCGKSTLALALLRRSKDQGFTPHIITTLMELNSADIKRSVTSGHTVLLFDGTLGEVRVDRRQHDLWTAKRPGLMELVDQGRCRLIITLYPHVLREVRQLERGAHSPLSDRSLAVQVESTLDPEVKEQMLVFHLEERQMSEAEHRKVVQTVLQTDRSGPGFPWCCHRLAQHWSSYKDLALFSAPEESQALLFDKMVTHPIHGRRFAAVLALTMQGFHGFLHRPGQAQPELTRLGFDAFSDDQLAEYTDVLRGSVLTEDGKNYASRVLYDAAALALGRSFRLPTMLRACDVKFFLQHVRTTQIKPELHMLEKQLAANVSDMEDAQVPDTTDAQIPETTDTQVPETSDAHVPGRTDAQVPKTTDPQVPETIDPQVPKMTDAQVSETTEPRLHITVGLPACSFQSQQALTTPEDLHSLLDRVYGEMASGHLPEISQHPSLQCLEFLLSFERYCDILGHSVQQLVSVVDPVHGLPLVYWSVFCRSDTLTQWCLTHMTKTQSGLKLLSPPVLLACAVFDQLAGNSSCRLQSLLKDTLPPKHFSYKTYTVELPLLADNQRLTGDGQQYLQLIIGSESPDRDVHYLCDRSMPIPAEVIKVQVSGGKVRVEVGDRRLWYVAQRLIADREVDGRDGEGNTLLHAAISKGNPAIIQLAVQGGASLSERNSQGQTAYCLAQKQRSWWRGAGSSNVSEYFTAIHSGDMVKVKTLLCLGVSMEDRDRDGHTGRYAACKAGQGDIADLLTQLGAEASTKAGTAPVSLHDAAGKGNTGKVMLLLCRGADINVQDENGKTALHVAILEGHTQTAELLIGHNAAVNVQDEDGKTALHVAVLEGHTQTAELLIGHNAAVNVQDEDGKTALHVAVLEGHTDTADLLIRHNAAVNVQDKDGRTPLHVTVLKGHTETAELLIGHNAAVNVQNNDRTTLLHYSVWRGHTDTAELLIRHKAAVNVQNKNGNTPLHYTVRRGHTDTAELLIRHNAAVNVQNKNGKTPLHYTVVKGHTETAELLIGHNAAVNVQNNDRTTLLHYSVWRGHTDTAELLIRHNAAVNVQNKNGNTPLHYTVRRGHTDTAELLIQHKAAVNVQDKDGRTPLHDTVSFGCTGTADLLIRHNAAVNVQDKDGLTPLHYTVWRGHTDTAELLIWHNASVNVQDKDGKTPLHYTVSEGHTDTAELLIRHNASVNVQDKDGATPLHYTVVKGHTDTAELLIRHNAAVNVQDKDGATPLHDTVGEGHTDTAELLIRHNAAVNVVDKDGHTPLQVAISEGRADTATLLKQYSTE